MGTSIHNLRGKAYYAKLNIPDEYSGDKRWVMAFAPNDLNELKATGVQLKVRDETDNIPYKHVILRRPTQKLIRDDLVVFTPPAIFHSDGSPMRRYVDEVGVPVYSFVKGDGTVVTQVGEAPIIGNDSDVEVRLAVYDTQQGKGHRLEAVTIHNLVEYEKNTPNQEEEKKAEPAAKAAVKKPKSDANIPWSIG